MEVLSQAEAGEQVRARFGLTDAGLSPERFAKRGFAFVNWRCNLAARSMVLFVTSVIRNMFLDLFGYHHFITLMKSPSSFLQTSISKTPTDVG